MNMDVNKPLLLYSADKTSSNDFQSILRQCIHCGLCLDICPTYQLFSTEMESPRGRIALVKSLVDVRIEKSDAVIEHFDQCLGCLACQVACPSGVQFTTILEVARIIAENTRQLGSFERFIRWMVLHYILPNNKVLYILVQLTKLYQISGLQRFMYSMRLLPSPLRTIEVLIPPYQNLKPLKHVHSSIPPSSRGRVGLFRGCVQEAFLNQVNQATKRVLEYNGFEVVVPNKQTCCGALHFHLGSFDQARELAVRNIDAFLEANVDAIIVNAGGCGAMLQDYVRILVGEEKHASHARAFVAKLHDVSEFLTGHMTRLPQGQIPLRVAYSDSCHLRNAQGIVHQPRELLSRIPGIEIIELESPQYCCGSAGIYNILHPKIANSLLEAKVQDIKSKDINVVAVSNPGCQLQIMAGIKQAGLQVQVLHLVELLDISYSKE
jgi:glycolate oxidase iron-sulfur subunit